MTIAIDYRTQYEAAEERIRELETTRQVEADYFHNELKELRGRIAKAREILKSYTPMPGKASGFLSEIIRQALEALKGK